MNLANRLTVFRILSVPFFIGALLYYRPETEYLRLIAILIFVVACVTDAADGYLARKRNEKTTLGSYLDPLADKLLLVSGFLCLSFMPHLPSYMHIPA